MTQSTIVLLGGSAFIRGVLDTCLASGIRVVTVDRNITPEIPSELHVQCDLLDADTIIQRLKKAGITNILGAYSAADIGIKSANKINAALTGRSVPEETLRHITSKNAMTRSWEAAGLLNRESTPYTAYEDSIRVLCRSRKSIIKPNNSSSSRGITILPPTASEAELKNAFNLAQSTGTDGVVLVEEFVEGTEITVEMLGDDYGNVAVYGISTKYHTENTINNKIAVKLHYNALTIDEVTYQKIAAFGIACYRAFGLRNSLGHLEILRRHDGSLVPVEMNARSAGFVGHPLVDVTSGRCYLADYLNVLGGSKVPEGLQLTNMASMYFFYDLPSGMIAKKETNITKHLPSQIRSIYHNRSQLRPGRAYSLITCDNDRYGFEVLVGDKSIFTIEAVLQAERLFLAELFGNEPATQRL